MNLQGWWQYEHKVHWAMESLKSKVNKTCWIPSIFKKRLNKGKIESNILSQIDMLQTTGYGENNNPSRHLTRMNIKEIIAEVQLKLHATENQIKMSYDTCILHQP